MIDQKSLQIMLLHNKVKFWMLRRFMNPRILPYIYTPKKKRDRIFLGTIRNPPTTGHLTARFKSTKAGRGLEREDGNHWAPQGRSAGLSEQYPPPKFNSLPLKIGNPKRKLIFQPCIFRGYVKLPRGSHAKMKPWGFFLGLLTEPNSRKKNAVGNLSKWPF